MKVGVRKPSLKRSFKARTTGRAKRAMKKALIPGYGAKGAGWVKNPKKAAYNRIYQKTTIDALSSIKKPPSHKISITQKPKAHYNANRTKQNIENIEKTYNIEIKDGKAKIGGKFYTRKSLLKYRLFLFICGWFIIICGWFALPIGIVPIGIGILFLICANAYKNIAKKCI